MKKFNFIPEENLQKFSQKERFLAPLFMSIALLFIAALLIVIVNFFATGEYVTVLAASLGIVMFVASILLLRDGKRQLASWVLAGALLSGEFTVLFLMTNETDVLVFYKMALYLVLIIAAQGLIVINRKNLIYFTGLSLVLYSIRSTQIILSIPEHLVSVYAINAVVLSFSIILVFVLMFTNYSVIAKLNNLASKEKEHVEHTLNEVTNIVQESKSGLEKGQILSDKASSVNTNIGDIHTSFGELKTSSVKIKDFIKKMFETFSIIEQDSKNMLDKTQDQNNSISDSSSALAEISATISNMNTIVGERQTNMSELMTALSQQKVIIGDALSAVNDVKQSSEYITQFIHTVEEIANQTGLLAMNASIEAAHAGQHGKGFAVIAQEIRKLSEETSKNSVKIAEVLTDNEKTVEKAFTSVDSFAKQSDKNLLELQNTLSSLEGILMGISEINTGTHAIMNTMQHIVDVSKNTEDLVEDVSAKISDQKVALAEITDFTHFFDETLLSTDKKIDHIQEELKDIKTTSDQNVEMSNLVTIALEKINI